MSVLRDHTLVEYRHVIVHDPSIHAWTDALTAEEARLFERARRRFLAHPSRKRLHAVRTAARRLRSLLDDLACDDEAPLPRMLRRIIKASGKARDATVLRNTLRASLDETERHDAGPVFRDLRKREREYTRALCRRLRKFRL